MPLGKLTYHARLALLIDELNTGIQWLKGTQMPAAHDSLLERITIDSDVRFGKPCIRGHRITVQEILEWLSSGASQQQILADYPQLEPDDFLAVYAYAAELTAGSGDRRILDHAAANGFILVSTDPVGRVTPNR
jgi:uncharacterized protein (DUF433 family)